jgi:hypothetical protein
VPERQLTVAEMVLPRPLQRGELVLSEYLVTMTPAPSTILRHSAAATSARRPVTILRACQRPPGPTPILRC